MIGHGACTIVLTANEELCLAWLALAECLPPKLVKANTKRPRTLFEFSFQATTEYAQVDESENNDLLEIEFPEQIGDVCETVDVDTDSVSETEDRH